MDRKPFLLSAETQTTLASLLQLVIQTGQLEAHSAYFRLFSFNSMPDFKKDFGIPNSMLLPPGLHRGRSFSVSLKAHASQLIDNNRHKVWAIESGETDAESRNLWLHRPAHQTTPILTAGIQRLTDYIRSVSVPIASEAESIVDRQTTVFPNTNFLNNSPYICTEELITQLRLQVPKRARYQIAFNDRGRCRLFLFNQFARFCLVVP